MSPASEVVSARTPLSLSPMAELDVAKVARTRRCTGCFGQLLPILKTSSGIAGTVPPADSALRSTVTSTATSQKVRP